MTGAFRGLPCTMEKRSAVKGKKMNQNLQNAITLFKQEPFAGTTGKWSNALISLQSRFRPLSRSSGGVALRKGIPESQSGPFQDCGFPHQARCMPPVTPKTSAVMKLDSWEARKTYSPESSTGCPALLRGVFRPNSGRSFCSWPPVTCRAVQMGPGATTLTRMPLGATCLVGSG